MSNWVDESEIENQLGSKVLLAGLSESGKTAIKRLFFQNSSIEELKNLSATINYDRLTTTINNVPISILDLGGQQIFIKHFLSGYSPFVFSSVKGLIFLIDISNKKTESDSIQYFDECIKKLELFSPKAEIFVFIHKIDLIKHKQGHRKLLDGIMEKFQVDCQKRISFFFTTIYEPKSVINAFLRIFELLIPNKFEQKIIENNEHFSKLGFTPTIIKINEKHVELEFSSESEPTFDDNDYDSKKFEISSNQLKITGNFEELTKLQKLMKESSILNKNLAESNEETTNELESSLKYLQKLLKQNLANKVQIIHNRDLFRISKLFNDLLKLPNDNSTTNDTIEGEFLSKNLLKNLSLLMNKDSQITDTKIISSSMITKNDFERNVDGLQKFFGIQREDAKKLIMEGYVDLFNELVIKSNIPIETVLQVLLVNIPYLKILGYDGTLLTNKIILQVFKYYVIGTISEREIYQVLELFLIHSERSIEEIVNELKNGKFQ